MELVRFDHVTKDYPASPSSRRPARVITDVSFGIQSGEIVGLLGPNRAGKTTVAKLLLSLCQPTSGVITRMGQPSSDRRTLARVGYLPDGPAFSPWRTAQDLLLGYAAFSGLAPAEARSRAAELLEIVGLADRPREPIARFSKGMLQRLGLAQALLNDPDLLVLDEPAEGLDLVGRKLLSEILQRRALLGQSSLLITHAVLEAGRLCGRVLVLVGGRLVHDGPISTLSQGRRGTMESALSRLYQRAVG